jgi:hypothetical protein
VTGFSRHSGYERQVFDYYREPEWAVDWLLDAQAFAGPILDPACGSGTVPRVCCRRGMTATGSDIVDRGFGSQLDFFDRREPVANIISNPPFRDVERFIRHALSLARIGWRYWVASHCLKGSVAALCWRMCR